MEIAMTLPLKKCLRFRPYTRDIYSTFYSDLNERSENMCLCKVH